MGIGVLLHAIRDLLHRYGAVTRLAWKHRKEFDPVPRLPYEREFLPASLALQETPVSPAPRVAMWLLITFAIIAVLWSIFGHVDVVATAQGKIVPNEGAQIIQPLEASVVKVIHVADGQKVKTGDVLIELDATSTGADARRLENDLVVAKLQSARAEAFLKGMDGGEPVLDPVPDVDPDRWTQEYNWLDSQWQEYKAKLERTEADIARAKAEIRSNQEMVTTLQRTVPMDRERADVFKTLYEDRVVSKQDYMDKEKQAIEEEGQLAAQADKLQESQAALEGALKQKTSLITETRRTMMDNQHDADQKVTTNAQELVKAQQRHKLMRLVAPVDGSVQQLAIHTVGGVVTPAEQLMVIVPADDPIEVEAFVENKDIGFVNAGQKAEIKIETFPYTKYGTLHGLVKSVSSDAIDDENRGLVYSTRIKLNQTTIRVENKTVNLGPGMAVTAEIKTGKRRVIEYFLTPLLQHSNESLRER